MAHLRYIHERGCAQDKELREKKREQQQANTHAVHEDAITDEKQQEEAVPMDVETGQ